MKVISALKSPSRSIEKIRKYGAGRLVMGQLRSFPILQWHVREPIRLAKMAADARGYARRKKLAREISRSSAYKDFFPERQAYRNVPPGAFPAIDKILPVARAVYAKFLKLNPSGRLDNTSYSYLLYDMSKPYTGERVSDLRAHPEFLELASFKPFVDIASMYLGEVPVMGGVDFQIVSPNDHTVGFQQFHIDSIARRQLKIFIAVEDVDEGNGATVIIPADKSAEIAAALGHRFGRIADERIMSDEWRGLIQHAAGPAGSAFFFDTCRAIHCGARTRTRPRQLIMLQYVSKYSYAESYLETGRIEFDRKQIEGDPIRELLWNVA